MKIFVLDEAGELAELRQVAPEEIDLVHHAKNARHLAFAAEHACENNPRRLPITELARDQTQAAAHRIGQVRTELEFAFLRVFKRLHQLFRLAAEKLRIADMKLSVAAEEIFEVFFARLAPGK